MLFGNKQKFCLEVQDQEKLNKDLLAQLTLWIGGEELGDQDKKVMLSIPANQYRETMNDDRSNQLTEKMPAKTAWEYLELNSFGEGGGNTERHNICVNFSESFDGESLFLVTYQDSERYLWKKFGSSSIKELKLPLGEYKKVIEGFIQWFNRQ